MLWIRFIPVITLLSTLLCERFVDNRLLDFSTPYAATVKNTDAEKAAILESINNVNFMAENQERNSELNALYQPYQQFDKLNENRRNSLPRLYDFSISDLHESIMKSQKNNPTVTEKLNLRNSKPFFDEPIYGESLSSSEKLANTKSNNFFLSDMDNYSEERQSNNAVDSYKDLLQDSNTLEVKRGASVSTIGCDCKIKNDLLDLGQRHFPRYLLNAVCQSSDVRESRCWRGECKPLEYKVKVLTSFRSVKDQKDPALAWLPDDLRQFWRFKTVTVAAGCFCAVG